MKNSFGDSLPNRGVYALGGEVVGGSEGSGWGGLVSSKVEARAGAGFEAGEISELHDLWMSLAA